MQSKKQAVSLSLLRVKVSIICSTPALAAAAEAVQHAARKGALEDIPSITWLFLFGFSMLGWAVSELDKVAELWNVEGHSAYEIWKARLGLAKGVAASNAAGLLVYLMGKTAPAVFFRSMGVESGAELPDMILFVFVSGSGYMGARWFGWLETKITKG